MPVRVSPSTLKVYIQWRMFGLSFGDDTSRNVTGFESSDRVPIVGDRIIIIIGGDNSMTAGYW